MIFVECKPDRLMVRILADVKKKEIRHAGNKFEVMKQLDKHDMALGIIDEDPGKTQPVQLNKAKDISKDDFRSVDLVLLSYGNNIVLVLRPRLEEWLLKTAKEINIDLKKLNLPADPERLHSVINYNLDKFSRLLTQMKYCTRKSKRIGILRNIIKNYKQHISQILS